MRIVLVLLLIIAQKNSCISQKIINAVMVDDNGITNKVQDAKYLVVVKKNNDSAYERLDYNFRGPIVKLATYKDPLLQILHGHFATFSPSGYLAEDGGYENNKKEGIWYFYNDTAHATRKFNYQADEIVSVVDLDSLAIENKKIKEDTTGQIEASYKGGDNKFSQFIKKNFKVPERTMNVSKGGMARAGFVIDTAGNIINIRLVKSVEFALDEEFLRIISLAKGWTPASDKGKKLKAYREIPLNVTIEDH